MKPAHTKYLEANQRKTRVLMHEHPHRNMYTYVTYVVPLQKETCTGGQKHNSLLPSRERPRAVIQRQTLFTSTGGRPNLPPTASKEGVVCEGKGATHKGNVGG